MADLDAIVAQSVKAAHESSEPVESPVESVADESTDDIELKADIPEGDIPAAKPKVAATAVEEDADPAKAEEAAKAKEAEAIAKAKAAEDELDLAAIPAKEKNGRDNRIPHSRVVKITENAVAKATKPLQDEITTLKKAAEDHTAYKGRVSNFEKILLNDKPRFIEMLRKIDGYAPLLDKEPAKPAPDLNDKRPEPDVDMGEGKKAYSPEALDKLLAWNAGVAKREAIAEAKKEMDARLSPFEKERKAREDDAAAHQATASKIDAELANAPRWEGWKENEAEILKALNEDTAAAEAEAKKTGKEPDYKFKSVFEAYQHVVFPKMKADKKKIRDEVVAELKKAPVSTSVTPKPVAKVEKTGPRDLDDVVREAIAASKA